MKKIYFIDFDHTLFNTDQFIWVDLRNRFLSYGLNAKCWDESYAESRRNGYTLEKHIKELEKLCGKKIDINILKKIIKEEFSDLNKYLFIDTIPFLKKLKEAGHKIYLLSFGAASWQHYKVAGSDIDGYFTDIFYQKKEGAKIDKILEFKDDINKIIVIDNSAPQLDAVKEKLPNVQTYLINRVPANLMKPVTETEKLKFLSARKYALQKPKHGHITISSLKNL